MLEEIFLLECFAARLREVFGISWFLECLSLNQDIKAKSLAVRLREIFGINRFVECLSAREGVNVNPENPPEKSPLEQGL